MIYHIETVNEFEELIKQGECLIDFFATWCGPCKMIAPVLEGLDKTGELKDVKIIKIDVDELPPLAERYGVQAIPTLLYVKDGKIVRQQLGFMNKNQIISFVDKN